MFLDYLTSLQLEFSPVDLVAQGVVKIAEYADKQSVFHLKHPQSIDLSAFFELAHKSGIFVEASEGAVFDARLQETVKKDGEEYIFEAFQSDLDGQGRLVYESNIQVRNNFTEWFLKKVGFEWKNIGEEYLKGYREYFRGLGYLNV